MADGRLDGDSRGRYRHRPPANPKETRPTWLPRRRVLPRSTALSRSPFSRVWRRSANARACTSAPPASAVCTTWSGRSSTTRSTRRWPATPPGSTSRSSATAASRSPTTAAASRSRCTPPGVPTIDVVMTQLHAGGKFGGEDSGYTRQRWSARRRRLGGQRAVHPARGHHPARRLRVVPVLRPLGARHPEAGRADRRRPAPPSGSGPIPTSSRPPIYDFETVARRLQEMAFLNKGLTIDLDRRARHRRRGRRRGGQRHRRGAEVRRREGGGGQGPAQGQAPHLPLPRRSGRLRQAHQPHEDADPAEHHRLRRQGSRPRGRDRDAVERRLLRVGAHLRQHHQHPRGRHARRGLPQRADHGGQQVRQGQEAAQGEGRQPHRRRHPRGPGGGHLGEGQPSRSSRVRPRPSSATPRSSRSCRRSATSS